MDSVLEATDDDVDAVIENDDPPLVCVKGVLSSFSQAFRFELCLLLPETAKKKIEIDFST
jgi:hypothetical protein